MARSAKPKALPRYRTYAGTPNELDDAEHDSPAPAKNWLRARMKDRKKWGEAYSHKVRDEIQSMLETLDGILLADAKKGREWEWRAVDDVSGVQFVFRIEVLW